MPSRGHWSSCNQPWTKWHESSASSSPPCDFISPDVRFLKNPGSKKPPEADTGRNCQNPPTSTKAKAGSVIDTVVGGLAGIGQPTPSPGRFDTKAVSYPPRRAGPCGDALREARDAQGNFQRGSR
jgi:hypothetical protein